MEDNKSCGTCGTPVSDNCSKCFREYNKVDMWVEKPKENPMKKYIEWDLDMEFNAHNDWFYGVIGKLTAVSSHKYFFGRRQFNYCRLRQKHVHFWGFKSEVNPIPDGCEFRVYYKRSYEFSAWTNYCYSDNFNWKDVLMFEILYTEENDNV